jgi:hypothetical protein
VTGDARPQARASRECFTVVTASGVVRTSRAGEVRAIVSGPILAGKVTVTSGLAGSHTRTIPARREVSGEVEIARSRVDREIRTMMTSSGVLRTTVSNATRPLTSSSTGGPVWVKPAATARVAVPVWNDQDVTPITFPSEAGPGRANPIEVRVERAAAPVDRVVVRADCAPENVNGAFEEEAEESAAAALTVPGGLMSVQSRQDLSTFISTSVLPKTNRVYEKEWLSFKVFVREETGSDDPFMTACTDDEKAALVALLMMRKHQAGKRGKAATAFMAAIRQMFARTMRATAFFDSSIIATARTSCLMKPAELRAAKDNGPPASVKLPICEGILADLRVRSWPSGWSDDAKRLKAVYVGTMYGFETAGRIGEFTHSERGSQDHCARVDDFTFTIESEGTTKNVLGSGLAGMRLADSVEGRLVIVECRVRTVSSKGKVVVKPKLIARRSPEEAEFLDDLSAWITHSGTSGKDEAFSFRKQDGNLVCLTGRTVRDEIKKTCASNGLPPDYFSAHSLRKGAITHMRAQGASEDDRRDRGNYAAGSTVMNNVYDYATGLGPLASNSLEGGHRLDKQDLKRLLPPKRKSV